MDEAADVARASLIGTLGPFGAAAPSALSRYFTFQRINQELIGSTSAVPTIPHNSNRWAICMGCALSTFAYCQLTDAAIGTAPLIWVGPQDFRVVTFAEVGPLICEAMWCIVAPAGGSTCYEIIFNPQWCP